MEVAEAVEIVLVARRAARRIGHVFKLDHQRLASMGMTAQQIAKVEYHAAEIEQAIAANMMAAARDRT